MKRVSRLGQPLLRTNAYIMLSLGVILFLICNLMSNPSDQRPIYFVAAMLVPVAVLASAIISHKAGLWAAPEVRNVLYAYGFAFLLVVVFATSYWFTQSGGKSFHALTLLTAALGIYWGMWLLVLALRLREKTIRRNVLCISAAITTALGLILATSLQFSEFGAATAVACYTSLLGIQGLSIIVGLHNAEFDAKFGHRLGASA